MTEVFLISENGVRSTTNIDNNTQSKFLLSAIREAQEMGLQQIIGTPLLNKLKSLVESGDIRTPGNAIYKAVADNAQLYLAYQSVVNLCTISAVKISNGGLQQTYDENLNVLGIEDTWQVEGHYQQKADFFAKRLQGFLLENKESLPELTPEKCSDIRACLYSAGTTSIFLGGRRGRSRYNRPNYI